MTLLALLLVAPAHAGSCAIPVSEFTQKVDAAEQAYATFEVGSFSSSMDEAALMLPCLSAVIPTGDAAHYLRMLGLQYFVEHDNAKADAVFGAARSLDSIYQFPESLIPAGHPVRTHYAALDLSTVHNTPIGAPKTGAVYFNGAASTARPGWPAIVQVVDAHGSIVATSLLFPGDALPAYDALPLPVAKSEAGARKPLNPKVPLAIVAGAAVVGSASLYARAAADAADFRIYRADDTIDDLVARQQKANNMVYASASVGVLAVGCAVGAVFVGKW